MHGGEDTGRGTTINPTKNHFMFPFSVLKFITYTITEEENILVNKAQQ